MTSIRMIIIDLYVSPCQGSLNAQLDGFRKRFMCIVPWGKEANFLYPQGTTEIVVIFEK